jgi:hypothetical protein
LHNVRKVQVNIGKCFLHDQLVHGRHGQAWKADDQNFDL